MKEIDPPRTTSTLVEALIRKHEEIEAYLASLDPETFEAPQGEFWSPEGHLQHLVKAVRPVQGALRYPKLLLFFRFGPHFGGASRNYEEVRSFYRGAIAGGVDAGRYSPSREDGDGAAPERQERILRRWADLGKEWRRVVAGWGEGALDRLRLPHPLLGKMTVREILLWTLYHNHHHLERVKERSA